MAEPRDDERSERMVAQMMAVSAMVGAVIDELVEARIVPAASLAARLELAATIHAPLMPEVSVILRHVRRSLLRPSADQPLGRILADLRNGS